MLTFLRRYFWSFSESTPSACENAGSVPTAEALTERFENQTIYMLHPEANIHNGESFEEELLKTMNHIRHGETSMPLAEPRCLESVIDYDKLEQENQIKQSIKSITDLKEITRSNLLEAMCATKENHHECDLNLQSVIDAFEAVPDEFKEDLPITLSILDSLRQSLSFYEAFDETDRLNLVLQSLKEMDALVASIHAMNLY